MEIFMKEFEHLEIQLEDIKSSTNNFDDNKVIGRGGFGKVYLGEISHSKGRSMVAFKRLDGRSWQGGPEFFKEIRMLSSYTHKNLISLLGFCSQRDEMILVYEYASRGSLDRHLSDDSLTWTQRIRICLDAAKGLSFLHDSNETHTHQRLLHCDIKSANILLDDQWNAKVSDFGLSKIGPANQNNSILITNVVGTPGYCDPLYMETYSLTKESDVYSFGVVLFEVLCGRLCYEYSNGQIVILVPMWKKNYEHKNLPEIILEDMMQEMDPASLRTFSEIAFKCLQNSREERPTMSFVVKKLEIALKFQEVRDLKVLADEDGDTLENALPPMRYRSVEELNVLLSKGVLLKGGTRWFSLNDNREHRVMISIDECFASDKDEDYISRYSSDYNSRFAVGSYNTRGDKFKTRVRCQFLTPGVTYITNLVFKCPKKRTANTTEKRRYIAIWYEIECEKRSSIVYLEDKKEDEWLMARLYQFNTSKRQRNIVIELEIEFDYNRNIARNGGLEIEGIEFQPIEKVEKLEYDDQVVLDQYKEILEAAYPPLIYKSVQELKLLLATGILLNRARTWFYINDKGQHCEMISMKECVVSDSNDTYCFVFDYNSRFPVGCYYNLGCKFKTCVRTQFLSPDIRYTVNLVFRFQKEREKGNGVKQSHIALKYKLHGETRTSISYLADKTEENWWRAELFQFTSDGKTVDLEIIFEGTGDYDALIVEDGIEFQPLEKAEYRVLEDDKLDIEPISDADTYWEQKLPNDYEEIIKWSKDCLNWTTTKELYSVLRKGFLTVNGDEWLFLDKNGKRCQMLSVRAIWVTYKGFLPFLSPLPESRFERAKVVSSSGCIRLHFDINSQVVLSPQTTYASYLVYKLPKDQSSFEGPVIVEYEDLGHSWYIYLVSPKTPVLRPKTDQNTHHQVSRPKIKGIPQQRSDGWMEVQIWGFQTATTAKMIPMRLTFTETRHMCFKGLIIEGIELRPI